MSAALCDKHAKTLSPALSPDHENPRRGCRRRHGLLYRGWLDRSGSDVVDAVDGRDAIVKALSVRPALVITELRLPVFDGFALGEVLRRDFLTRTVAIVSLPLKATARKWIACTRPAPMSSCPNR
jgi:hypothetical protein